jgi:acyl-coenzyme A synthetase/AMP-(fatty) acid ligase
MYGQTEATARMAYLLVSDSIEKAGSIGMPIVNGSFILENSEGEVVSLKDEPGELIYSGPNVSLGYAESWSDLGDGDDFNGVLRTGDIAVRDSDGFYYIVGRKKRFIKIFGNRVNLQDIEDYLLSVGHKVACAGSDDRLEIYTTITDSVFAISLKKMISSRIQIHQSGIVVLKVSSIPYNDSGKIQYANLSSLESAVLA